MTRVKSCLRYFEDVDVAQDSLCWNWALFLNIHFDCKNKNKNKKQKTKTHFWDEKKKINLGYFFSFSSSRDFSSRLHGGSETREKPIECQKEWSKENKQWHHTQRCNLYDQENAWFSIKALLNVWTKWLFKATLN